MKCPPIKKSKIKESVRKEAKAAKKRRIESQEAESKHLIAADVVTPEGKTEPAIKTLRDDPLGRLHSRRQITDTQYAAGDYMRQMFENFGSDGVRAMDFTKPFVDNSPQSYVGVTQAQSRCARRIKEARHALGNEGFWLVYEILGRRRFIEAVAAERGVRSKDGLAFFGKRFRETLDTLAVLYGFTVRGGEPRTFRDKHTANSMQANNPPLHRALRAASEYQEPPQQTTGPARDEILTLSPEAIARLTDKQDEAAA